MKLKIPWDILFVLIRILIGLIFVYSGWSKVTAPIENFRGVIAEYKVLPYALVPLAAFLIPWLELIFGFFLIVGYMTRFSALVISGLCFSFVTLLVIYFFKNGTFPADCGCFGEDSLIHLSGQQVLLMDLVNAFLTFNLFLTKQHRWSLDSLFIKHKPS